MKALEPKVHLLRELYALSTISTLAIGLFAQALVEPRIGVIGLAQLLGLLFGLGLISFLGLSWLRSRRLGVRASLSSALVAASLVSASVGGVLLGFKIWFFGWPGNLEPTTRPDDYTGDTGVTVLIAGLLILYSLGVWLLGLFAVGQTSTREIAGRA